jgi:hypothetical protein
MKNFPYLTDYVNEVLEKEQNRFDYVFLRPVLLVLYFLVRPILFSFKYFFHRREYGFEKRCIDSILAFGIKYFASYDAIELMIRHVQIEPLLYRFILTPLIAPRGNLEISEKDYLPLKGIFGDFSVNSISDVIKGGLTIAHDDLSYDVVEKFSKNDFIKHIDEYRSLSPENHEIFGKAVLEENKRYSMQWFGATNVVIFVCIVITVFGDLKSVVRALNSFGSDSILLWCLKNIYADDQKASVDLDFYMQANGRTQYRSSPFLSDPSQYLYQHISFGEFAYELLRKNSVSS